METFDKVDADILAVRERMYNEMEGPRVGDFLRTPDGFLRFTHDWGETIQTTVRPSHPCSGNGSFYLGEGNVSFSGSLDPGIDKLSLKDTGEKQDGTFWFFHHNFWGAGRGVDFKIPCRVFVQVETHEEPTYENQLWKARKLLEEKGYDALNNPHAMIGRTCGCGSCFTCAAAQVIREYDAQQEGRA